MCSEQMDVNQARVLGSIPDFFRLLFLRPSHFLLFSPMEIGKGQSEMVVNRWPGKGRRDWLEPLRPRMGSTKAGVTSALWGPAMGNPLLQAEDLLPELLFLCSNCFSHHENALFEGRTSQKLYKGNSLTPADN